MASKHCAADNNKKKSNTTSPKEKNTHCYLWSVRLQQEAKNKNRHEGVAKISNLIRSPKKKNDQNWCGGIHGFFKLGQKHVYLYKRNKSNIKPVTFHLP